MESVEKTKCLHLYLDIPLNKTHQQTTGRHDDSPTVFFYRQATHRQATHRHDHWPTQQVTDTVFKILKTTHQLTRRHSLIVTIRGKLFCQSQSQFIHQSRQKDTKNICHHASHQFVFSTLRFNKCKAGRHFLARLYEVQGELLQSPQLSASRHIATKFYIQVFQKFLSRQPLIRKHSY